MLGFQRSMNHKSNTSHLLLHTEQLELAAQLLRQTLGRTPEGSWQWRPVEIYEHTIGDLLGHYRTSSTPYSLWPKNNTGSEMCAKVCNIASRKTTVVIPSSTVLFSWLQWRRLADTLSLSIRCIAGSTQ